MSKKIGILTGGGDCPGLNPAIKGCVWAAEKFGYECVGLTDGWKGLVEGLTMPLNRENTEFAITQGGTMLGTSRTNPFKKDEAVKKCLETFKRLDLHALVAMGGEDTLGVATRFYRDHKLNVVGVPKTMDNDLSATDYTFGFDTSVTKAMEAAAALLDTGRSHRRVMVLEVMGRHAGWVALFTAIASSADFVCIPEKTIDTEAMLKKVKDAYARKKCALVITSEASELPAVGEGEQKRELDQFGHVILKDRGMGERIAGFIEKNTGLETRSAVIGHMQRGGAPTLFDRMLGVRVGVKAAELVRDGAWGQMSALVGNNIVGVPLEKATGALKTVDAEWDSLVDILL
jgi:ATP-dependent phosphofructokinase / diphosphate-dependent phosphofructokinase